MSSFEPVVSKGAALDVWFARMPESGWPPDLVGVGDTEAGASERFAERLDEWEQRRVEAGRHGHVLAKCPECKGRGLSDDYADSQERRCELCDGRGYKRPEECAVCGEPMGKARRAWKRSRAAAGDPR